MFTVAVVEDEPEAARRLGACLGEFSHRNPGVRFDVTVFPDPTRLLEGYRPMWDIVFMDIEMPNMDGMSAARRLRALDGRVLLVFVTNMAQFAAKGYEVDALDYIIKPFSYNDFERKIRRAVAIRGEESASVMIVQRAGTQRVLLRDIEYIEVREHNLLYHTERGILTGTGTLQDVEGRLGDRGFLRCSKAFVVNSRHVAAVKGNELTLSSGESVTIGRTYRKSFMMALAASMGDGNVM
ncbi:LytR/AlgR family response regulator transcription factor [Bifidobacterium moukalabense]|uniref:LytR/AlgR family response regulator transcription factor n=1 Tax=Bifidobacterium moukalabense TaxID=1333651 RepID=UPI0010F4CE6E|nr:LytTR family DNA-binding domain-containing protein [Bifidobacterium moukalabense]